MAVNVIHEVGSIKLKNGYIKVWFDNGTIKYFKTEKELKKYKEELNKEASNE